MASTSQTQKGRDGVRSMLSAAIKIISVAKLACHGIPPAQAAFGIAGDLLTMIRDSLTNQQDFVDLGRACADVCRILDRGLKGRQLGDLSPSVLEAIGELTTTLAGIQSEIVKLGKRNAASQAVDANSDKDKIVRWNRDLDRIRQIFNIELDINTNILVTDIHRKMMASPEDAIGQRQSTHASVTLGESPPPPPRACFGRDKLIKEIVGLAENLEPVALIGAGGIGKTSIALAVLHHDRVKDRFGDNRRFLRCDRFPPSYLHFLARISQVIGAGVANPEDLTPLRPFLSSREMILFLDNAESILDPQGADSQKIKAAVEELSRFENICLGITSRITTVPPHCNRPVVPTLSAESACDIFYAIYTNGGRSNVISDLLRQLDFHALSITLLATTAAQNMWDCDRLAKEWDARRVQVLQTPDKDSLAATIELSLGSPTFLQLVPPSEPHRPVPRSKFHRLAASPAFSKFIPSPILRKVDPSPIPREIPPSARELLEVVAFFPQGIDEKNLDWLFPTTPNRKDIFDKFCVLSLTHRNNGFITMLAPIRDYLCPLDPESSPLLCATKDRYFTRLSAYLDPDEPGFQEAEWIKSEDVNVEHLLDVFISINPGAWEVWDACEHFMNHLYWHKPRHTLLAPKIEGLPDGHQSKANCLFELSTLFRSIGNWAEEKRLLVHTLTLEREKGDDVWVARTLRFLCDVNRMLGLYKEGIQQAEEALEIYKRSRDTFNQVQCLNALAFLLLEDEQLDGAENAASHAIDLIPEKGQEFQLCQSHLVLGLIYRHMGEKKKALDHFETALRIASRFNWQHSLFWNHYAMAALFSSEGEFGTANTHVQQAKSHTVDNAYNLGSAMGLQALVWFQQRKLEEARSEGLAALEVYERLGAAKDVGDCRELLQEIEQAIESQSVSGKPDSSAPGAPSGVNFLTKESRIRTNTPSITPAHRSISYHFTVFIAGMYHL
ncbi:hypothetical protein BJ322DRAFT_1156114 [Thelephora terrestris]|uniref:NACHT domain-containing protein n=1 Tax=Thelephora terrestris TaxID=56493 RepID=A0A9P6HBG5_9AGAM|nr:hypothetical protein BJ322DRAFT_1156114 [Thelephora terrestris]